MDIRSMQADTFMDSNTGLPKLHLAIGFNDLEWVRSLIDAGARLLPDKEGRTPSVIASLMETSEEMQDYIAEKERKAEANQ